jgi:Spy/CpxP family protein refolding chaperone
MKLVRTLAFSLSVAGVSAFALACGGSVEQPQTTASAATKAPVGADAHGVVKLVGSALGDVALRPEQRTDVDKLVAEAEARHAPLASGRKELVAAFADQVEKGTIDRAALQPKIDKVAADLDAVRAEDRAALTKLHGLLDASQRGAFVDALEARMKAKHGERGERGFGKLKQLADDLKLTDEQKSQLREVFHGARKNGREAFKQWRDQHGPGAHDKGGPHGGKRMLEAFRDDKLDLDKTFPTQNSKEMVQLGSERMTSFAEKVLPILTPDQRKIAADKLRSMSDGEEGQLLLH